MNGYAKPTNEGMIENRVEKRHICFVYGTLKYSDKTILLLYRHTGQRSEEMFVCTFYV